MHPENAFITLTYAREHLPENGNLNHRHFQLFMKRLRKKFPQPISYYMAGEYGEINHRPHYHACLFGVDFKDKIAFKGSEAEDNALYTSPCLTQLWPYGHATSGKVNFQTAAYVARYVMKKITGDAAIAHYTKTNPDTGEIYTLTPEYNRMSLNPAIGKRWIDKYKDDVYPDGQVVINGKLTKSPRYYDSKQDQNILRDIKEQRAHLAEKQRQDQTTARLKVRETVTIARLNLNKRKI